MGQEISKRPRRKFLEQKRKEHISDERIVLEKKLDEEVPASGWTASLENIPVVTHSAVEHFFKRATDTKHLTEGYAFSKTKKFETSGKPIRINLLPDHDNMFLLEGHTRPAKKQAKRISTV